MTARTNVFGEDPQDRPAIIRWISALPGLPGHILRFCLRILFRFFGRNNGLLLAGAVAYNTLLSLVPLCALILVVFSVFIDQEVLLQTLQAELVMIVPGQADAIGDVLVEFLSRADVIGIIGVGVVIFFSSIAFRILENAMAFIFEMPAEKEQRSFWVSALLPYLFISILGLGITILTAATSILDALPREAFVVPILGWSINIDVATTVSLYISGVIGLVVLFTALYMILPQQKIALRRALVGGVLVAALWEIIRQIMVWYFAHISLVNVLYGSLATVIIVLLTMEVAAVIVLLGAEVIADLERAARAGLPWYAGPDPWDLPAEEAQGSEADDEASQRPGRKRVRTHRRIKPG